MGTEGMRASLVSREVICRLDRARRARAPARRARLHRRLRQDDPRRRDGARPARPAGARALQRLDRAGPLPRPGRDHPGRVRGGRRACRRPRRASAEVHELESAACPGAGACGGQFTANTMAMVLDFLGISPPGLNSIPATDPAKKEAAREAGRIVMDVVRRDMRPSQVITRDALENAVAAVAAHRRLHQRRPPPARDRARARAPARAGRLRPHRRPHADRRRPQAGGPLRRHRSARGRRRRRSSRASCSKAGLVHGDAPNVAGGTLADAATAVVERPGQEVVVPVERAAEADRRPRDPARQPRARAAPS